MAAVEDYTQALAVDPQSSYAHYNRGIIRDRLQVGGEGGQGEAGAGAAWAQKRMKLRGADASGGHGATQAGLQVCNAAKS